MTCQQDGCDRPIQARGYCTRHYAFRYTHGLPMPAVTITPYSIRLHGSDVDEAVVERLVAGGYDGPSTSFERREAVRRLKVNGLSYTAIADRIGTSARQVHRDLARFGLVVPRVSVTSTEAS